MILSAQVAKHLREVFFGGNWTTVNLKDEVAVINWEQATLKLYSLNSIAVLFFHLNYYVTALIKVLEGGPLDASDKFSFQHPPIDNEPDWQKQLHDAWDNAERLAGLIEHLPDASLWVDLPGGKYGHFYRNFCGIVEHAHYHLGQIVLIKKILAAKGAA